MAKAKKVSLLGFLDGPSGDYEKNYQVWNNKSEWKLVGKIKNRIMQMYQARQGSCYTLNYDGSKSWDSHWDLLEKDYLAWSEFDSDDDFESNLKSTMAYRTAAAIDARERRQDIDFMIEPANESDNSKGRATTHKYIFRDYFKRNRDVRYKFLEASKAAKIFGTAIAFIPYSLRIRTVKEIEMPDISKEQMEAGEIPAPTYKEKTIVDFDDVDFVPWNLRDFYIDPNAQNLQGTSHAAVDAAGILYVTPAQVRLMFSGDPEAKNIDKITSTGSDSNFSLPYFKSPRDVEKGFCELIFYYNVETDSEIVICNDVIIKDNPIPYQDKKIPFIAFHFVRHPGHFYGMGVGDLTLQQSSEDAAIRNSRLERIKLTTNPPTLVGATIFGDMEQQWNRLEPNLLIKVADVSQVRPLEFPNIPFDSFRISEELKNEAVMNTGVNPQGLTLPMSSTPATNTLAMKETASDMINMYSDNLMEGMNYWGKMLDSRFCQYYSRPYKKAALELGKKKMRELRLEDINLFQDDKGNYKSRSIKGAKMIPLTAEMFEWEDSPNIYISPDFIAPISQAFQMRKAQEILPQLVPLAGDPGNGQPAVIDIRKLVKWYLDKMDMNDADVLLDEDEDRMDEMAQAQDQQEALQKGEEVPGIPGEPRAHRYAHAVELIRLNDTMSMPEFSQMAQVPDPNITGFVDAMNTYRKALATHLRTDSLLVQEAPQVAVQQSDTIDQMSQPQMPQMPMNNMVSIPTVSGNMGLPNSGGLPVPNNMNETDVMGQQLA